MRARGTERTGNGETEEPGNGQTADGKTEKPENDGTNIRLSSDVIKQWRRDAPAWQRGDELAQWFNGAASRPFGSSLGCGQAGWVTSRHGDPIFR